MIQFKIFPATITPDRRKIPLIKDWKTLASNDPQQIKAWQEQFRERITHWAIPTGKINDLLVLDVDVKSTYNGWKAIEKRGLIIPDTMSQKTMSGGSHFLFHYPKDGRDYGNKVGIFGPESGVDIRGEAGYIFFYGVNSKPIVEPPAWLIQDSAKAVLQASGATIGIVPEIAQAILEASLEAIREAPQGESNNVLNIEAFKVGQLVASQSITRQHAEAVLMEAAIARGKPQSEARATITSGLDGGCKKPLISPFGDTAPVAAFPLPSIPPPPQITRWTPAYFTRDDLLNSSKLRKPQLFKDWSTEDIHITTGDGGTGKTTLKLYEAICLALGERFLGFDCKQTGKTLFITGEDTDKKLAAMMGAIIRQMGLFENVPGNNEKIQTILASIIIKKDSDLCIVQKDKTNGFLHLNSDALRKVLEAVADHQPKMIVLDPISSFWGSEAALNDMNKAVIKFASELVDHSGACVDMINHSGKQSSANKDMTQFAGRGGSGLPSNARVARVLRTVFEDEYADLTGESLGEKQSAMMCNVGKFTDGSPLLNKQFLIVRDGYLFTKKNLTPQKQKEADESLSDIERVFTFVKAERAKGKYPTRPIIIGHHMGSGDPISEARTKRAIDQLHYSGHCGEFFKSVENIDATVRDKMIVIVNSDGREI